MQHDKIKMFDQFGFDLKRGIADGIILTPNLKFELYDQFGKLKDVREVHNTVTTAGKEGLADQALASPSLAKPGWLEVGTGTPSATKLGAYISGSRTALSSKTRSGAVITMVCTLGVGVGTGAITEAGIFDVVTQNTVNMWVSASFSVINKAAGDSMTVTWTLTVG